MSFNGQMINIKKHKACIILYTVCILTGECACLTVVFKQGSVQGLLQLPLYRNHYKKDLASAFSNWYTSECFLNAF